MEKLISVIVPIYDVESYLSKCIDSIINQTYKNIEVLLIDDGSTDNCLKICRKYEKMDNRIKAIHKLNGGLSSARNCGLNNANGDLISFIDGDDFVESTFLEELKKSMDSNNSDISICSFFFLKNNNTRALSFNNQEFCLEGKEKFEKIQNEYVWLGVAWNKLYKKKIFNDLRFPEGMIFEDSYLICDIFDRAKKISFILKPLYYYVYRNSSIINNFTLNHFNKIDSYNNKIDFYNKKGYYDLALKEKSCKLNSIILNLAKMKRYNIKNEDIKEKYYKELLKTNKDVKWKDANRIGKLFKICGRISINALAVIHRVRDWIYK